MEEIEVDITTFIKSNSRIGKTCSEFIAMIADKIRLEQMAS